MIERIFRSTKLEPAYNGNPGEVVDDETEFLDEVSLITSETHLNEDLERLHAPVLDIDFTAALVPSTTPGKYHLYLDKLITESNYFRLLEVLGEVGILEEGYVNASLDRGYTAVRPFWVEKDEREDS